MEEVDWVMKMFSADLIVGIDSLLEWVWLGKGFEYSECFENIEEGRKHGKFGLVWWPTGVEKGTYKAKIKVAWAKFVEEIGKFNERKGRKVLGFLITYLKQQRSVGNRTRWCA